MKFINSVPVLAAGRLTAIGRDGHAEPPAALQWDLPVTGNTTTNSTVGGAE